MTTHTTTRDTIEEAEALLAAATPGEWRIVREDAGRGIEIGTRDGIPIEWIRVSTPSTYTPHGSRHVTPAQRDADAALIAAGPRLLRALVAELRAARAAIEAAREECAHHAPSMCPTKRTIALYDAIAATTKARASSARCGRRRDE